MKKKKEEKEISEREIRRLGLETETASTTSTQTSVKNTHNSNHTVSPSTLSPCQSSPTSSASPHDPPPQIFASSHPFDLSSTINWSDTITHMPVQRIDIPSPDATERVNALRREGVPVVITNHKGWASFADPWLKVRATVSNVMDNFPSSHPPPSPPPRPPPPPTAAPPKPPSTSPP